MSFMIIRPGRGLAAAGLADQAYRLPARDVEADPVDRPDRAGRAPVEQAPAHRKVLHEIADGNERRRRGHT